MPERDALLDATLGATHEEYLHAVELARAVHDPTVDWEGFRDTLWSYLVRVFGRDVDEPWPQGLPDPRGEVSGDAATVAAWMAQHLNADESDLASDVSRANTPS